LNGKEEQAPHNKGGSGKLEKAPRSRMTTRISRTWKI